MALSEAGVTQGRVGGPGGPRPRLTRRWRQRLEVAFFVTPALVLVAVFIALPVAQAVRYSVFSWNGFGPLVDFVGLDNYRTALADPVFRAAIRHNLTIVVASVLVQLPLGLGIALLLDRRMWGRAALRTIVFVPYVLAEVIAGVIWIMLLQPRGPVDALLEAVGLGRFVQLWLADPSIALATVFVVLTWKYLGLAVILLLAGLQGVPEELHEASQIDGASWWQTQWRVTIPLLGPTIRTWAFLSMIGSLQLFDMVWILTGGGPVNATATMATYLIDQGTERRLYGYASAVAVLVFVVSLVLSVLYQTLVLRRDATADRPRRRRSARRATAS